MVKHVTAGHPLPPRPKKEKFEQKLAEKKYKVFSQETKKVCQVCRQPQIILVFTLSGRNFPMLTALSIDQTESDKSVYQQFSPEIIVHVN